MTHWVRALAALLTDTGSIPSNHLVAYCYSPGGEVTDHHNYKAELEYLLSWPLRTGSQALVPRELLALKLKVIAFLKAKTRRMLLWGLGPGSLWQSFWLSISRYLVMHLGMVRCLESLKHVTKADVTLQRAEKL